MYRLVDAEYKQLFEALPERALLMEANDEHYNIIDCSDSYLAILGRNRKDILGQPTFTVFPDVSEKFIKTGVSELRESFRKVIKTGQADTMDYFRYDIDMPNKKGNYKQHYWQVVHHPIFGEAGKLRFIMQVSRDITDEKQTEDELSHMRQELEDALSIGKVGSWTWDIISDKIIANRNMAQMFGIDTEEAAAGISPAVFTNAVHLLDRERMAQAIAKTINTKGDFEEEYRTIDKTGDHRWVLARGKVETDAYGKVVRFPGVIVDITDRKQTELNLSFLSKASAALSSSLNYKKTLQNIADLAVPTIADWCSVEMIDHDQNLQPVALAHKDPAKIQWAHEMRQREGPVYISDPRGTATVVRTGKVGFYPKITDKFLQASIPDKKQLALARKLNLSSVIMVPIILNHKPIGVISLISAELRRHYTPLDVEMATELAYRASLAIANTRLYESAKAELSERRRLEDQLKQANLGLENRVLLRTQQLQASNTDLSRSNQELQDFAYVASHDLQEPLRKIQAFSNLLQDEYGEVLSEGTDYLNRMSNAASRMGSLIEDLLSFSRVTTQARPFVKVDLAQVTREVLSDLEVRVSETKAHVSVGKLPAIKADPMQMRQLLQNLIGNALKFNRIGVTPKVRVTAKEKRDKNGKIKAYALTVADNGIGFDEKYLDRIFAVFQRLHSREAYQGTGIGLAICRKIVERHGGTITAKNNPDAGAIFIITLPVHSPLRKETRS
jgi:PAS domain S-box-containing protein